MNYTLIGLLAIHHLAITNQMKYSTTKLALVGKIKKIKCNRVLRLPFILFYKVNLQYFSFFSSEYILLQTFLNLKTIFLSLMAYIAEGRTIEVTIAIPVPTI